MLPANFTATRAPYTKILSAVDADQDGLPDASPSCLIQPLCITEASLHTSPAHADTDADGLSDLQEAMALPLGGTNPRNPDSDGDGRLDGVDPNPAYRMADVVTRHSPQLDGTISSSEGWTLLTDRWGYTNGVAVSDNNLVQASTRTYAAWDGQYLYLQGPPTTAEIYLDGSADNWFLGPDNYQLTVSNAADWLTVRTNVGVPDIFRQIDDDGQFSEFFDTDPKFTQPYAGRHFYDQEQEGLGFPGRLVTEQQLSYARGGAGPQSVWELAIPWSHTTLLQGGDGQRLALSIDVDGDRLFSSDHAAVLTLRDVVLPAWQNPLNRFDVTGDGQVTLLDVLTLIAGINLHGPIELALTSAPSAVPPYSDVDGDGWLTPSDVLAVVYYLNAQASVSGEGELLGNAGVSAASPWNPASAAPTGMATSTAESYPLAAAGGEGSRAGAFSESRVAARSVALDERVGLTRYHTRKPGPAVRLNVLSPPGGSCWATADVESVLDELANDNAVQREVRTI